MRSVADGPPPTVTLRPWLAEDAPTLAAAWSDPEIAAGSQPPVDRSVTAARRWIEGCALREQRMLAIDRVIDVAGACVGEVGLSSIDQRRDAALIGWWVAADRRGNGYARAGVGAMAMLAAGQFGVTALVAEIGIDNIASVRLAERAGFEILREGTDARPHAYVLRHGGSSE